MRFILTECKECGWRFPRPLEIEVEGYTKPQLIHTKITAPAHILQLPNASRETVERARQAWDAAMGIGAHTHG